MTNSDTNHNSPEKLHGATFGDADNTNVVMLEELLDQIGQGLEQDDATNFEKLQIARKYGPVLLQLKEMVPHGQFKKVLKERFPRISYSKCNRWMMIAKNESKVAKALKAHLDEAWGPKKMVDYLTGEFEPKNESDGDEDNCLGCVSDDSFESTDDSNVDEDLSDSNEDSEDDSDLIDDDSKNLKSWEKLVSDAKSESTAIGNPPTVISSDAVVNVTVFSPEDHAAIEACLSEWELKSIPIYGQDGVFTLTANVLRQQIPDLLLRLAKAIKKSLPEHLNVSIKL